MMTWLRHQGDAVADSYDHEEALAGSDPMGTALAAGALAAVLGAVGYVPYLATRAEISHPWIPLVLTALAALVTYTAWRHQCRGLVGTSATLLDNALYSSALAYASATATEGWGIGLAVTHGLMVLAFPAQAYALTLPFAVVMGLPLVVVLATTSAALPVVLVLTSTYVMVLAMSFLTGRRLKLLRERERLREAIHATHRVADESVQMALTTTLLGLGHFLHELRNSQAAMRANLEYIKLSGDLDDKGGAALADAMQIQQNEQKLVGETIDQLRDRSKATNAVFMLGELLESVVSEEASSLQVSLEGITAQRVVMSGTRDHLRIVLTNLLRNAEQAGAKEAHISLRIEPSGRSVRLTVCDDGPGLPEDADVFLPFTTSKDEGTGLGLYLCRRYVELFGGSIETEESPLGGAAFRMSLPARVLGKRPTLSPAPPSAESRVASR